MTRTGLVVLLLAACIYVVGVDAGQAEASMTLQEIRFQSRSDTLSGFLILPEGSGPFPAFVVIQGSGPASIRTSWQPGHFPFWKDIAEELVRRGFAVLAFDKPGVGDSTGDWRTQSFADLAQNVKDAIAFLRSHPAIDGKRIGVIGHSQGGWIAQMVAARAPDEVAFVISLAGPSISVREQILDDLEGKWRCSGHSGPARSVSRWAVGVGLGMYELVSRVKSFGYLGHIIGYEPGPDMKRIRQPMLAIFAGNDRLVYPDKNAALVRQYLTEAGNEHWVVEIVPQANHWFQQSDFCEAETQDRWADGFWKAFGNEAFWKAVER